MKIRSFSFLTVLLLVSSPTAFASPVPGLSSFFRAQLAQLPKAVLACELAQGADTESWQLDTVYMDASPYVGIGIPSVFQIQVAPEIEFVFTDE